MSHRRSSLTVMHTHFCTGPVSCVPGYFDDVEQASICSPCPAGTFQPQASQVSNQIKKGTIVKQAEHFQHDHFLSSNRTVPCTHIANWSAILTTTILT